MSGPERHRGDHAGRVPGVHAGLLDVLHDRADPHLLAVAQRVHVDLDRVLQEAVEEDGVARVRCRRRARGSRRDRRASNRSPWPARRARSWGAPAADSPTEAPPPAPPRESRRWRRPGRAGPARPSSAPKLGRSSARWIDSTGVPSSGTPASARPWASLSGVWPAELHDHALRPLQLDHGQHVLQRQRLEVEPVGGVVVGGDGLRVAVHHHGVAAELAHRHRGVHAAVVELDSLPDPVRARAEDHHRGALAAPHLVGARVRSQPE